MSVATSEKIVPAGAVHQGVFPWSSAEKTVGGAATMPRPVAGSSNGRTPDSGSGSQGSSPCPAASKTARKRRPKALVSGICQGASFGTSERWRAVRLVALAATYPSGVFGFCFFLPEKASPRKTAANATKTAPMPEESRVKSTIATMRKRTPARAFPNACLDM